MSASMTMILQRHSGVSRFFLIGVGIPAIAISAAVLISPFGAILTGTIIAISLLITGIQMIFAGIQGRKHRSYQRYYQTNK